MKTKITLLIAFLSLSFSSCIKDYYGHPDDKKLVLTEKNYVYSEDIRFKFLEAGIASLDDEIKILKVIIDSGKATDIQKERFYQANLERDSALKEQKLISDYRDELYKRGPIPPPPCPEPRNCDEYWFDFNYITVPPAYKTFIFEIFDENQNVIAKTEGDPQALGGFEGYLNYVVLKFYTTDYHGPISVKAYGETIDGPFEPFFMDSNIN